MQVLKSLVVTALLVGSLLLGMLVAVANAGFSLYATGLLTAN